MKSEMHQWRETIKLKIRFIEKYLLHRIFLPAIYQKYRKQPVQEKLVLFADAKNNRIPFSMQAMYEEMKKQGYQEQNWMKLQSVERCNIFISL